MVTIKEQKTQWAYTLIEMMVVLVIIGVMVAIAYPSMMNLLYRMESKRVESVIVNALTDVRNETYIRRQNLMVCLATKLNVCHKQAGEKMLVFRDTNASNQFDEGELVREYRLGLRYGRLEMRVSSSRDYMKYFSNTATPRGHFGHIKYCSDDQALSYKIVISHQGRIRREEVEC